MNWSRVKTILIFLFLAVDIGLLLAIIIPSVGARRIPKETITATVEVLKERGITVEEKTIPAKRESMGIVELYNIWPDGRALATQILGGEAQGGENGVFYREEKTLRILSEGFEYNNPVKKEDLLKEFDAMGISPRENFCVTSEKSARVVQTIEDKKIFETEVFLTEDAGRVSGKGYWIFSDRENGIIKNTPDTLLDVTGVLIDFIKNPLREEKVTINSVETGYSIGTVFRDTSHKLVSVSPAYKITLDDGTYYIYDALSGEFLYAYKNGLVIEPTYAD